MRIFKSSTFKSAIEVGRLTAFFNGLGKTQFLPKVDTLGRYRRTVPFAFKSQAMTYDLDPGFVKTFATSGLPFLTFYEFGDLAGWCRDTYFAPDHVKGYKEDIGTAYTVWTHEVSSQYHRHIFPDQMKNKVTVSFEIPFLDTVSWFPLRIRLYDEEGLYFKQDQKLVVEKKLVEGNSVLASWRKVPQLKRALPKLHAKNAVRQTRATASWSIDG